MAIGTHLFGAGDRLRRRLRLESLEPRLVMVSPLAITELMYNPAPPDAGPFLADDFEFIELQNTTGGTINLLGLKFTIGVTTELGNLSLAASERGVLVKNEAAFVSRYGAGPRILGTYLSTLSNGGEQLRLENASAVAILDFTYSDGWYPLTDGQGFSLVINDPAAAPETWGTRAAWRTSQNFGGNPAATDNGPLPGSITVNEILAHTDAAVGDWIELYNPTTGPIDISGWFLSDQQTELKRFRIPAGTVVPAGSYKTFTQFVDFGNAANPNALVPFQFTENGEAAFLTAADAAGNLQGYREDGTFPASEREVSFGRYTKSTGGTDFVAMATSTFGAANSYPKVGPVVINEVMYGPPVGGDEWIELYNSSNTVFPLYDPVNPGNTARFTAGVTFDFPPNNPTIQANGFALVVGIDPAAFRTKYSIPAAVPIFGPWVGTLNNAGETISLAVPGLPDQVTQEVPLLPLDLVKYNDSTHWPTSPDTGGPSLARVNAGAYGNTSANWQPGPVGGTPGAPNGPVTIAVSDAILGEGQSGTTNFAFNVSLSSLSASSVTVAWATASGTATSGVDFTAASGTLTLAPGVISQLVTVAVKGETVFEPAETFVVNLTNPSGASLQDAQGQATIENDDATPPWQNPANPLDVVPDGVVKPQDVLVLVNELNRAGQRPLTVPPVAPDAPPPYYDVFPDNFLSPQDVLLVVNYLNSLPPSPGAAAAGMSGDEPVPRAAGGSTAWTTGGGAPMIVPDLPAGVSGPLATDSKTQSLLGEENSSLFGAADDCGRPSPPVKLSALDAYLSAEDDLFDFEALL